MRMGTFLLGGIAGMAAVVYLNRKTNSTLLRAFTSKDQSVGNMIGKAANAFSGKTGSETSAKNFKGSGTTHQVEEIIKEDPAVHQAVNKILHESTASGSRMQ
jgi:hypothetical protein